MLRTLSPIYISTQAVADSAFQLTQHSAGPGLDVSLHAHGALPDRRRKPWVHTPYSFLHDSIRMRVFSVDKLKQRTYEQYLNDFGSGDLALIFPGVEMPVYEQIKKAGHPLFVEFVNCHRQAAHEILRSLYENEGLEPPTQVNDPVEEQADFDRTDIADFVFAPSQGVYDSLLSAGVPEEKVLPASRGWSPELLTAQHRESPIEKSDEPVFLFVGTINLRKGVHFLLRAWAKAGVKGRLVIAGKMTDPVAKVCSEELNRDDVELLGYIDDIGTAYHSADVFVMSSLEEAGPRVTYEAMGCGLPALVTPMGGGRVAESGKGVIEVDPHNQDQWIDAIRRLAQDVELRKQLGAEAREAAQEFTWDKVGKRRRESLLSAAATLKR